MKTMLSLKDVTNTIRSYVLVNDGDEATVELILAIGAELLDISIDEMAEMVGYELE